LRILLVASVLGAATACGGWRECPEPDPVALDRLPERLSETGLFEDVATDAIAEGVVAYAPRFALWSDGASKRRWLLLPAPVDATDPEAWDFPVGTRAWKEFVRGDVRVETRLIERQDDGWIAAAYVWDADGTDAFLRTDGVEDAVGTPHDVPSAADCGACHGGRESFLLGVSAVQLAGTAVLAELVATGLVAPAPGPASVGDEQDEAALGYLHANCSHCHNPQRTRIGAPDTCFKPGAAIDFTLPPEVIDVDDAPALRTAYGHLAPGRPEESEVLRRMSGRNVDSVLPTTMPPLATEEVDEEAISLLTEWLASF